MPNTLENTREFDETIVEEDAEVAADEETDEFAQYFKNGVAPKILITTSKGPSAVSAPFLLSAKAMPWMPALFTHAGCRLPFMLSHTIVRLRVCYGASRYLSQHPFCEAQTSV